MVVNDTSKLPIIRAVFYGSRNDVESPGIIEQVNEGDTFYLHAWGNHLHPTANSIVANITWSGTASAADFTSALSTQITMNLTTAADRDFKGVAGPFTVRADGIYG